MDENKIDVNPKNEDLKLSIEERIIRLDEKIKQIERDYNAAKFELWNLKADFNSEKRNVLENTNPSCESIPAILSGKTQNGSIPIGNIKTTRVDAENTFKSNLSSLNVNKKEIENIIGKSLMGILASILIFISLYLFASVISEYLTPEIKLVALYAITIGLTGFSIYRYKKDNTSTFYTSIAACGIGSVYIVLVLTNIYFKMIGDIGLYLLILIWSIAVCLLSKKIFDNKKIFEIIARIGLSVSLILGIESCINYGGYSLVMYIKFVIMMMYYVIVESTYLFTYSSEENSDNYIGDIARIINLFVMLNGISSIFTYDLMIQNEVIMKLICAVLITIMIILHTFHICKRNFKERHFSRNILFTVYMLISFTLVSVMQNQLHDIVTYASSFLFVWIYLFLTGYIKDSKVLDNEDDIDFDENKNESWNGLLIPYFTGMILLTIISGDMMYSYSFPLGTLSILLFLLQYRYTKEKVLLPVIYIFTAIHLFQLNYNISELFHATLSILLIILLILNNSREDEYDYRIKGVNYIGLLITVSYVLDAILGKMDWLFVEKVLNCGMDESYEMIIYHDYSFWIFIAVTILHCIAIGLKFNKNKFTDEVEKYNDYILLALNGFLMFLSLGYIHSEEVLFGFINYSYISMLIALALFSINTKRFIENDSLFIYGFYVGFKYTILLITILETFETESYLVSIGCLVLAITCIILGFYRNYRFFRLYGLGLAIICTIKLVLIDLTYSSTMLQAISFLFCGILCFAISYIYSRMEKKQSERIEEKE